MPDRNPDAFSDGFPDKGFCSFQLRCNRDQPDDIQIISGILQQTVHGGLQEVVHFLRASLFGLEKGRFHMGAEHSCAVFTGVVFDSTDSTDSMERIFH